MSFNGARVISKVNEVQHPNSNVITTQDVSIAYHRQQPLPARSSDRYSGEIPSQLVNIANIVNKSRSDHNYTSKAPIQARSNIPYESKRPSSP